MAPIDVPVLIVGAGPTGVTAALLLRRLGIEARIVERRVGPQRAPAAHVVNARTFEICRQAGVDMAALAAAAKPPHDAGATYWVSALGGEVFGQLPFERQDDDVLACTPTPLRNLSQHRFEPVLLDALQAAGAPAPHYGHRWLSCGSDADGVTSTLSDAQGREYAVRSRYLIGADGAGSPVRKGLGVTLLGPEYLQSFVMIHFEADLRPLVRHTPGVLYWICDPDCLGTFVAHDIDREWVFMHGWDPSRESAEAYDEARCTALVRRALARADVPLRLRTISPWTMTCQVADRYGDGRRIFLAGDAAHRFPPTGGLGLNTGVQDAHNLAWKLAAVLHGAAPAALLDTYERERRPVAQFNAEQSLRNAIRLLEVPRAFGFDEDPAVARRNFAATLADERARRAVAASIADQAEHFDMLGLQLGFAYGAGALRPDGSAPVAPANPVRDFIPSSRPGARLPHGWLNGGGGRRSTLDLIPLDRLTLLVAADGGTWLDAARRIEPALHCVRIGVDVADPADWWTAVAGMPIDGALLVRPDQHIAWRTRAAVDDADAELRAAVAAALGGGAAA